MKNAKVTVSLDFKSANEIAGAFARLSELQGGTILTSTTEAELRGLKDYLSTALLNHAAEFLGCWFTVRQEYEPLLKAFSSVAYRVQGILSRAPASDAPVQTTRVESADEQPAKE